MLDVQVTTSPAIGLPEKSRSTTTSGASALVPTRPDWPLPDTTDSVGRPTAVRLKVAVADASVACVATTVIGPGAVTVSMSVWAWPPGSIGEVGNVSVALPVVTVQFT